MAMKDFDFKSFLLNRGELLGLGLAVVLAAVFLMMGSKGFVTSGPGATVQSIQKKSQEATARIEQSTPPETLGQVSPELLRNLAVDELDPQRFRLAQNLFTTTPVEDTKRRNPEVLLARDFDVHMFRLPFLIYELSKDERTISVLSGDGVKGGGPNMPNLSTRMRVGVGVGIGPGDDSSGTSERGSSGFGMGDISRPNPGEFAPGTMTGQPLKRDIKQMEIDKIGQNVKLAEQISPYHVAVVSAAFPYKQQLENFRKALLRKGTMFDLYRAIGSGPGQIPFEFLGLDIERRVTLPSGRIDGHTERDQGWKDFNKEFQGSYVWLFRRAARFEEEDPKLRGYHMILDGLVMARPGLARGQKYLTKEAEIPSLRKTVEDIDKALADKKQPVVSALSHRFGQGAEFSAFKLNPLGDQPGNPGAPAPASVIRPGGELTPGGDPNKGAQEEPLMPEHVLVRFLDFTVKAGHAYEYRIRVKMANPNFGKKGGEVAYIKLAKERELVSAEWSGTEGKPARVPSSQFFYAVDEKPSGRDWPILMGDTHLQPVNKERTAIQVHSWLQNLPGDKGQPVGNWILLERSLVHRGETIGRGENVEVPVWSPTQETDVLAASVQRTRSQKGVPIDFRVYPRDGITPAVLVDFDGGQIDSQKVKDKQLPSDRAPVQLLVMAPDGKLIARNSHEDTQDETRQETHRNWRQWIQDARQGRKTTGTDLFNKGGMPRGGAPGKPGGGGN